MSPVSESWLESLQQHGYRLTGARRAVVEIIANSRRALTPLEVYELARRRSSHIGLVSVYRTLEMLSALNLVQRVHQESGCNAYLPQANGHQHLLLCEHCGRAEYFQGDDLEAFFAQIEREYGYRIQGHWLQLSGLCPQCQKAQG